MLQPDAANEALSPAGSVTIGFFCLGAAVATVRYALRQRARDRAKDGKEIGSLDDLFAREYKGEPKYRLADSWDRQFQPDVWPWWMFTAIVLAILGTVLTIRGLVGLVA
jgi:hypothetical protein